MNTEKNGKNSEDGVVSDVGKNGKESEENGTILSAEENGKDRTVSSTEENGRKFANEEGGSALGRTFKVVTSMAVGVDILKGGEFGLKKAGLIEDKCKDLEYTPTGRDRFFSGLSLGFSTIKDGKSYSDPFSYWQFHLGLVILITVFCFRHKIVSGVDFVIDHIPFHGTSGCSSEMMEKIKNNMG